MRIASSIALYGLASVVAAQLPIPIPPATSTTQLPFLAGFSFQAPADGNLVGILVPDTAGRLLQAVDVIDLGISAPTSFVPPSNTTILYSNRSTPAGSPEPAIVPMVAGRFYAVMGGCMDTPSATSFAVTQNNSVTTWPSTILSQPATLNGFVRLGNLYFHTPSIAPGSSFTFGRVEATFVPTGPVGFASNTTLGRGCGGSLGSFYEQFGGGNAFDLANSSITMTPANGANGYVVTTGGRPFVPPTPAASNLSFTNNSTRFVIFQTPALFPTNGGAVFGFIVSDNGIVSTGGMSPSTIWNPPSVTSLLDNQSTAWCMWNDYDPTLPGSGQIKFEELSGIAYLTWDGVLSAGGGPADTFQFQFEFATGAVTFAWGVAGGNARPYLVGYSPAGPSGDPGSSDLSSLGALVLTPNEVLPLTVAPTSRPLVGAPWYLSTQNIPAAGTVGIDVFGSNDPGINDLGAVGAPGCGLRAALDVTAVWPVVGGAHGYGVSIPFALSLIGIDLYTTSAVLQPPTNNALGLTTANGIRGTIGTF